MPDLPAWKHLLIIAAVASAVMLTNLGGPRLWDRDEPRNAGCALEMLERGDWIVPTFNAELRAHKPVLLYWCIMVAYSLGGVSEFTARLPSALCAIGTALATYAIGRRLFNPNVGLWGGIVLSTSLMFGVAGRAATPDSLLIFCVTLAMMVYVLTVFQRTGSAGASPSHVAGASPSRLVSPGYYFPVNTWQAALLYGVMGLAVLAKGPVGLVLPTAIIGMFLLVMNWPPAKRIRNAPENPPHLRVGLLTWIPRFRFGLLELPLHFLKTTWSMRPLLALAMVALVAGPWFLAVGIQTKGAFLQEFFLDHNLRRASSAMEGHHGPIFYYPVAMLLGCFPWSIFAVPLVLETTLRFRRRDTWTAGYLFAVCWICVWVGIFSLAKTKLPSYVTPCYPALALLAGCFVYHFQRGTLLIARWWPAVSFACLLLSGGSLLLGIPIAVNPYLPGEGWLGFIGLAPLLAGGIALVFHQGLHDRVSMPLTAAAGGLTICGLLALGAQRADAHRHDQQMVVDLARSGDSPMVALRTLEPSWVFYSRRQIPEVGGSPDEVELLLNRNEGLLLVTTGKLADELQRNLPGEVDTVATSPRFLKNERLVVLRHPVSGRLAHRSQGREPTAVTRHD